jgi:flagellar biogenesis protein FliO
VLNERDAMTVSARGDRGLVGWLMEAIRTRTRQNGQPRRLKWIETLSLGGKRHLMLVSCDGTRFLVGVNGDAAMTIVSLTGAESCSDEPVEIAQR